MGTPSLPPLRHIHIIVYTGLFGLHGHSGFHTVPSAHEEEVARHGHQHGHHHGHHRTARPPPPPPPVFRGYYDYDGYF